MKKMIALIGMSALLCGCASTEIASENNYARGAVAAWMGNEWSEADRLMDESKKLTDESEELSKEAIEKQSKAQELIAKAKSLGSND